MLMFIYLYFQSRKSTAETQSNHVTCSDAFSQLFTRMGNDPLLNCLRHKLQNQDDKAAQQCLENPVQNSELRFDISKIKPVKTDGFVPYPETHDPLFVSKLRNKQEFRDTETNNQGKSLEDFCSSGKPFTLLPHQTLLRNFLAPSTPYSGLLVYHGTGSGKTVTAISIAESFKDLLRLNPIPQQRRVLVLALSKSIDANFQNNIYSPARQQAEQRKNMRPGSLQATGDSYYVDAKDAGPDTIRRNYQQYYDIESRETFTKKVRAFVDRARRYGNSPEAAEATLQTLIRNEYSSRVIVVDEVHNIKHHTDDDTEISLNDFKAYDALREVLTRATGIKLILMSATPSFNSPLETVDILNLLLCNDNVPELEYSDIFSDTTPDQERLSPDAENILMKRVRHYVSFLRGSNPISFPAVFEVTHPKVAKLYKFLNTIYLPKPKYDISRNSMTNQKSIKLTTLIQCPMSSYHYKNYVQAITDMDRKKNVAWKADQYLCTIVYPAVGDVAKAGKEGFDSAFRLVRKAKTRGDREFRYQAHCKGFLQPHQLAKFSSKYAQILKNILVSPGIAFVYCDNIDIGVETIAMILDSAGYEKMGGGHYLHDHDCAPANRICSICNRTRSDKVHIKNGHRFQQARYVVIQQAETGQSNQDTINALNNYTNRHGADVKIILGSPVTKESLDFHFIRQVHVASAWYNMSRIMQIIGRAVRNCSHAQLDKDDRNVTVFRYCTSPPLKPVAGVPGIFLNIETADEKFWRLAEGKDVVIKKIERLMKKIAFDCQMNKKANVFDTDQDYSRDCDYDLCNYTCSGHVARDDKRIDTSTYELIVHKNELDQAKVVIGQQFSTSLALTYEQILAGVKSSYPHLAERYIQLALDDMLGNDIHLPETVHREDGHTGYLIYAGQHYVFQPLDLLDRRLPLALRTVARNPKRETVSLDLVHSGPGNTNSAGLSRHPADLLALLQPLDSMSQLGFLDHQVTEDERVRLLEHLIESRADSSTSNLLRYFESFLLVDKSGSLKGHFVRSVPRCFDGHNWSSCSLQDKILVDKIRDNLFKQQEAPFVGIMSSSRTKVSLKIINNLQQHDRSRRDLRTALNTLTTGKACENYDRTTLKHMASLFNLTLSKQESKESACQKLEKAFRQQQLSHGDEVRWFYNALEWQSGLPQRNQRPKTN